MDNVRITYRLSASEEETLKKRQHRNLREVRKLLLSLNADKTMIDAVDQALTDNEQW